MIDFTKPVDSHIYDMKPNVRMRGTLTILEGPDGAGKSTLAEKLASEHGYLYPNSPRPVVIHHGPYKRVTSKNFAHLMIDAMIPALTAGVDVIMDRAWFSEPIYGKVFRGGQDRIGVDGISMLNRLALTCGAAVIKCQPSVDTVIMNFSQRRNLEMLDDTEQLRQVYDEYAALKPDLPTVTVDYTNEYDLSHDPIRLFKMLDDIRTVPHPVDSQTGGNEDASTVIIGSECSETRDCDSFIKFPFGSFNGQGCSLWLAEWLARNGISEQKLFWANVDQLNDPYVGYVIRMVKEHNGVFHTLGKEAANAFSKFVGGDRAYVRYRHDHPQYIKRFGYGKDMLEVNYSLLSALRTQGLGVSK